MGHDGSFDKVLYFTKCSVYLVCTWPPSSTATKWETMKSDIAWFLSFLSALCLCIPLFYAVYVYRHDGVIVTHSGAILGGFVNQLIKTLVYRVHRSRTQILVEEMESCLNNLRAHERLVLQRYFDRFSPLHTFICGVSHTAACLMILGPLVLPDQPLPTNAVYPFDVDDGFTMYLVYVHQAVSLLQCASGTTIDCQAALIMWFAGARLEILADEVADVTELSGFRNFVRKHIKLMSYANEVSDTMRYIVFASSTTCGVVAIMCGLQLLGTQPLTVQIIFVLGIIAGTMNLFISAWPADNLISVCNTLAIAVYNTSWFDMSPSMMKNLLIVLRRSQRPLVVSIGGFLPSLSLRSYASFLSGLFSYFTTLRVAVASDN